MCRLLLAVASRQDVAICICIVIIETLKVKQSENTDL